MTPAARIEAAIELLARIEGLQHPAEAVASDFVRTRRYMGSKDRRRVTDLVFSVLRARARLRWWTARAQGRDSAGCEDAAESGGASARTLVLAALILIERAELATITEFCDGRQYHPEPLDGQEMAILRGLCGETLNAPHQPAWVRAEVPAWLLPDFTRAFPWSWENELAALNAEAPLDLRVNSLLADGRESVMRALAEEGVGAEPTALAPLGLRVKGRRAVTGTRVYREGLVEIQDEGSQLVAQLVGARPGMAVCDLCAGAGGKSLALAGAMGDRGRLVALDVDGRRLARAGPRMARAGVHNVERRMLAGDADPWLTENAGAFDRVLLDAPCSGVGAWRRQPDARWRLSESALRDHVALQGRLLDQGARLVRPGGRLVYATCSLLARENEDNVRSFLDRHREFAPMAIDEVWRETVGEGCPSEVGDRDVTLTPSRHQTDGFYIAVLRRRERA